MFDINNIHKLSSIEKKNICGAGIRTGGKKQECILFAIQPPPTFLAWNHQAIAAHVLIVFFANMGQQTLCL